MIPNVIGVDVGGTKILAGVVGRDGTVVTHREHATPVESEAELLDGLEAAVRELLDETVGAVGFGIPSRIDQRAGVALGSVNVPLVDVPFRDVMRERLGLPVEIDNDANAAAIAEWRVGAGRGTTDMIMLTLGTGVGGGLILGGTAVPRLDRGGRRARPHRDRPRRRPVQLRRSRPPRVVRLRARRPTRSRARHSGRPRTPTGSSGWRTRAMRRRSSSSTEIGRKLGSGLGSLVNTFDPELIVIGGGFAAAGELLLAPAREVMEREVLKPMREEVRVVRAELGTSAGMIGAAMVAFDALDAAAG